MRPSGSLEIEGEQKQSEVFEEADPPRGQEEAAASHVPHNPWLLRCDRHQLTRLAAGALGSAGGGSGHDSAPPQSEGGERERGGGGRRGREGEGCPAGAKPSQPWNGL